MRVTAHLFAILRERAGSGTITAELPEGATVAEALAAFGEAHPRLGEALAEMPVVMAVNHEYAPPERQLAEGDELALVPPVSGGAAGEAAGGGAEGEAAGGEAGAAVGDAAESAERADMAERIRVEISGEPLSYAAAIEFVTVPEAGAVVTFSGLTREVERLDYEAYAPMAERRLRQICERALAAHPVERVAAFHRIGAVPLSEPSVIVAASSAHRPGAFAAARDLIDQIKAEAPIWKREIDGETATWVEGAQPPLDR